VVIITIALISTVSAYKIINNESIKKTAVALGPAALAVPYASIGGNKSKKCFSEVASAAIRAAETQQEVECIITEKIAAEDATV
jgi:hypothetical protein